VIYLPPEKNNDDSVKTNSTLKHSYRQYQLTA